MVLHHLLQILADPGHFFLFNLYRIDKGCSFLPACSNSHSCLYSTQGRKQSPPLQLPWKQDVLLLPSIQGLPGYKSQTFTVFTLTAKLNITFKNTQLCWDKIKINVLHCSPTCRHTCLQNVFLFTISKHFPFGKRREAWVVFYTWQSSAKLGRPQVSERDTGLICLPKSEGTWVSHLPGGNSPANASFGYSYTPWLTGMQSTQHLVVGTRVQLTHPWEKESCSTLRFEKVGSRTCHPAEVAERGGRYRLYYPTFLLSKY